MEKDVGSLLEETNVKINVIRKYDYSLYSQRLKDCSRNHIKPDYEKNICNHCYNPLKKDPHHIPLPFPEQRLINELFEEELEKIKRRKARKNLISKLFVTRFFWE